MNSFKYMLTAGFLATSLQAQSLAWEFVKDENEAKVSDWRKEANFWYDKCSGLTSLINDDMTIEEKGKVYAEIENAKREKNDIKVLVDQPKYGKNTLPELKSEVFFLEQKDLHYATSKQETLRIKKGILLRKQDEIKENVESFERRKKVKLSGICDQVREAEANLQEAKLKKAKLEGEIEALELETTHDCKAEEAMKLKQKLADINKKQTKFRSDLEKFKKFKG